LKLLSQEQTQQQVFDFLLDNFIYINLALTATLDGFTTYVSSGSTSNVQILENSAVTYPIYTSGSIKLLSSLLIIFLAGAAAIPSANMLMLSFFTKTINPPQAPFRLRFKLTSVLSTSGTVEVTLPANEFSYTGTNLICYFKTYTSDLDYTLKRSALGASAPTITGSLGTGFIITASPSANLAANTQHELVCDADDYAGFNIIGSDNKFLTATFTDTTTLATGSIPLYQYQATPILRINNFYLGTKYTTNPNTIILSLTAQSTITEFPNQVAEIEFSSASSGLIKAGFTALSRDLPCGIVSSVTLRTSSKGTLRCTLIQSSPPRVRIENYAQIATGTTFSLMLYDLDNSILVQSFIDYLDFKVLVTDAVNGRQSRHLARRIFTTEPAGVTIPTATLDFPTSSATTYSTVTTLTSAITWNAADTCTLGTCRFIIKAKNTDWKFRSTAFDFTIDGTAQTKLVDEVNNIIGKII